MTGGWASPTCSACSKTTAAIWRSRSNCYFCFYHQIAMAWLEEAPSGTFEKAKTYETASLGPRQEHARVESVKETRFADPALLLDGCGASRRSVLPDRRNSRPRRAAIPRMPRGMKRHDVRLDVRATSIELSNAFSRIMWPAALAFRAKAGLCAVVNKTNFARA